MSEFRLKHWHYTSKKKKKKKKKKIKKKKKNKKNFMTNNLSYIIIKIYRVNISGSIKSQFRL